MEKLMAYGEEYGRPIDPREAGVLLLTHVSQDRAAAWKTVEPYLRGLPMPPEDVAARCVVGTPQECVEKIQHFIAAGCVKFVLRPACPLAEIMTQIEWYGKEILPHFSA
jgi:alkanesulfonate monooxygenase SsuD/methylene tetrahydromethanopterin reductase-like flavin-dependent oxidoreductase (luciferase family)